MSTNPAPSGRRVETSSGAAADAGPRPVLDGLGWSYDPVILADAQDQAVPFSGDTTAHDRAWATRVQSSVDSMDVLDPGGLDAWIEAHARSDQPHLLEAALVAVWETRVRDLFDDAIHHLDDADDPA